MTDERIDALIRQLEVNASPDPAFVSSSMAVLRPRVRAARIEDAGRIGRLRRDLRVVLAPTFGSSVPRRAVLLWLALVLLLASLAAAMILAGALRSLPTANGPLIISVSGQLRAIDVDTGAIRQIGPSGENARHVSRSPDARLVAYWNVAAEGETLTFVAIGGEGQRRVSAGRPVKWGGCIDTWSPDSRYLATEVTDGGAHRILIADSATGTARFLTGDGVVAHCPVWSPDGRSVAFTEETKSGPPVLAVIGVDGSGIHTVSGDLGGAGVSGANNWSPDGAWIYFTTEGLEDGIWRANVARGLSSRLTTRRGLTAVSSSPDDRLISFIESTSSGWDLWVANSDGTDSRRLLTDAMNLGWSADSRYILSNWKPSDRPGGLRSYLQTGERSASSSRPRRPASIRTGSATSGGVRHDPDRTESRTGRRGQDVAGCGHRRIRRRGQSARRRDRTVCGSRSDQQVLLFGSLRTSAGKDHAVAVLRGVANRQLAPVVSGSPKSRQEGSSAQAEPLTLQSFRRPLEVL